MGNDLFACIPYLSLFTHFNPEQERLYVLTLTAHLWNLSRFASAHAASRSAPARPSDLSRAAARAAAPREPRPWLAQRALMEDMRRISEGLQTCAGGGGTRGVREGYGRSSSGVLVRRETVQLAVDPHAMHGASVDPFAAHVCPHPDVEKPLGSVVICERLVELESEGARHHVGLRWRAPVLDDARCLHACDDSDRPL